MGSKRKKAIINNSINYFDYLDRLTAIALTEFEWKNLPQEIDERSLELYLYNQGRCAFFHDDVVNSYAVMRVNPIGPYDIYNIPKDRSVYASNGYYNELNETNSVIIYNNYLRKPTLPTIQIFANRLADVEGAIHVNLQRSKTPFVMVCNEEQVETMRQVVRQTENNEVAIFGNVALMGDKPFVLNTESNLIVEQLQNYKTRIWSEALSFLGIDNYYTDKKERLISTEISSGSYTTESQRHAMLSSRRNACNLINDMFGLNIEVDFRLHERVVDNNGELYTGIERDNNIPET